MKEINLTDNQLSKIVEEFSQATYEGEGIINLGTFESISCEVETVGFDTFVDGDGCAFSGLPGIPLPFVVKDGKLKVYPCSQEYGLTCERGILNLQRSLRFFLMEIYENKLHIKTTHIQFHPLNPENL